VSTSVNERQWQAGERRGRAEPSTVCTEWGREMRLGSGKEFFWSGHAQRLAQGLPLTENEPRDSTWTHTGRLRSDNFPLCRAK
jgi:hypothetical protein